MLRTTAILLAFTLVGCYDTNAPDCTITCVSDEECPGDLTCGATGLCTGGTACTPIVESCTANEFQSCTNSSTALRCNPTGDGTVSESCGAPGCSASAAGCNGCVANAFSCSDANTLAQCSSDSTATNTVATCSLGCAAAAGGIPAHCRYLEPRYIADVCDQPAAMATVVYDQNGSLDTSTAPACTGGVLTQMQSPEICVIRGGAVRIDANRTLTVTGSRVIAFVADTNLDILGTLDASATGATGGPGVVLTGGAKPTSSIGGGGAGFRTAGAAGGALAGVGQGGAGGAIVDAANLVTMSGGAHPVLPSITETFIAFGGGGGGGVLLIACRGTVSVSGVVDVNGGGGRPGADIISGPGSNFTNAAGGGSGGYVVIQGGAVNLTGTFYANGGAGGGTTATDDAAGQPGSDGPRALTAGAAGGSGTGSVGGSGAFGTGIPGLGQRTGLSTTYGGGGGSTGRFQIYTPMGVTPVKMQMSSPPFDTDRTVMTR